MDCCIEKEGNVNAKANNSNKKPIMLIAVARKFKV